MSEHMIQSYRERSDAVNSALKRTDHGSLLCETCGEAVPMLPWQGMWSPHTVCPKIPGGSPDQSYAEPPSQGLCCWLFSACHTRVM